MGQKTKFKKTEIGKIPEDWERSPLSEVVEIIGGGTPRTSVQEYWDGDIPWISVVDFVGGKRWIYDTEKHITKEGLNNSSTKILTKGQLIISARGTVGEIGQVTRDMAFNQSCYGLSSKEKLTNDFLYYLLRFNVSGIKSVGHGAVFNTITVDTFKNIFVSFPPLPEQKSIAKILSDLDAKIELNNKMNKTLEAIGQALFKKWFVDNPDKDNWKEGKLKDILETIESGRRPKGGINPNLKEGIPSIGAENINGLGYYDYSSTKFIEREFFYLMKTGKVKSGDVLLYKDGAKIGRKSLFMNGFPFKECCVNEHVFILRSKAEFSQYFLYFWLDQNFMTKKIINLNSNAAQPGINQSGVLSLPILLPDQESLITFDSEIEPIISKMFVNCLQNQKLAHIRDSLLPKLMSGEIRVK